MQCEQVDPPGVRFRSVTARQCSQTEKLGHLRIQPSRFQPLQEPPHSGHRRRIALLRTPLGANPEHPLLPAQPLDDLLQGRRQRRPRPFPLAAVKIETGGIPAQRIDRRLLLEHHGFGRQCFGVDQRQHQPHIIEGVRQRDPPLPRDPFFLELPEHLGQRPHVPQRLVRIAGVDAEAIGQEFQPGTPDPQRPGQRQRVVRRELGARHPPQDREVEAVTVVGNQNIVAQKIPKRRPDFFEVRSLCQILFRVAVGPRRPRRHWNPRPDQPMKLLDPLPVPHPERRHFDDLGRCSIFIRRLQVDHDEIAEGLARPDLHQLQRLEYRERKPELTSDRRIQHEVAGLGSADQREVVDPAESGRPQQACQTDLEPLHRRQQHPPALGAHREEHFRQMTNGARCGGIAELFGMFLEQGSVFAHPLRQHFVDQAGQLFMPARQARQIAHRGQRPPDLASLFIGRRQLGRLTAEMGDQVDGRSIRLLPEHVEQRTRQHAPDEQLAHDRIAREGNHTECRNQVADHGVVRQGTPMRHPARHAGPHQCPLQRVADRVFAIEDRVRSPRQARLGAIALEIGQQPAQLGQIFAE